jgi:hypothetical protein
LSSWKTNTRTGKPFKVHSKKELRRHWDIESAQRFLRDIEPELTTAGYRAEIVGGVARKGHSDHDLDVLLKPINEDYASLLVEELLSTLHAWHTYTYDPERHAEIIEAHFPDGRIVDFWFGVE